MVTGTSTVQILTETFGAFFALMPLKRQTFSPYVLNSMVLFSLGWQPVRKKNSTFQSEESNQKRIH